MARKTVQSGFTLLEVMLTLGLLVALTIAMSELLRGNIDIRISLSEGNKVTHRLAVAMERMSRDIQHAFIIPKLDQVRKTNARQTGTIFKYESKSDSTELRFTSMSHVPLMANSKESDLTFIVYRVDEDPKLPGYTNLYRGAAPFIPENFRTDPPMRILAKGVKSMTLEGWRGDRWIPDRWDSSRGQTNSTMPHMVRIKLEVYDEEPVDDEDSQSRDYDEMGTSSVTTILHLANAVALKEKKRGSKSIRWDKLE